MVKYFALIIVLVLTACDSSIFNPAGEGLNMGNIRIIEGNIRVTLSNISQKSGDVVIIASVNGNNVCTFITHVGASSRNTITAKCGALGPSGKTVNLGGGWASHFKAEASIARLIQ